MVVLGANAELTVAEVRAALGGDLAHTTVMTVLVRLTEKGAVTRRRHGRSYRYCLAAPASDLAAVRAAMRMRNALDREARRADVLANFVDRLSSDEEQMLREILGRSESRDQR